MCLNYNYCFPDRHDIIPEPYTINCVDDFIFSHAYGMLNETVIGNDEYDIVYSQQIICELTYSLFGCLDSCVD